ncbi:MAG TPA: hypothetical protein VIK72_09470 [Clostridiaceae bacterium]
MREIDTYYVLTDLLGDTYQSEDGGSSNINEAKRFKTSHEAYCYARDNKLDRRYSNKVRVFFDYD